MCIIETKKKDNSHSNDNLIIKIMDKIHTSLCHKVMLKLDDKHVKIRELNANKNNDRKLNSKFVTEIEIDEKSDENSNEQLLYQFGKRLYYWPYFKTQKSEQYIEKPKYDNIKEESLNNTIKPFSMYYYKMTINEAKNLKQTNNGKLVKAEAQGKISEHYMIPGHMPITLTHIYCALIYCNFTETQYLWKKNGTRSKSRNESIAELKERNKEIGHWYKSLIELTYFFGGMATRNCEIKFWHGLSISLLFDDFIPKFGAPISTTTDFGVAQTFAEYGIILQLRSTMNEKSNDRYFSCSWLSDYPEEREMLFGFTETMRITDIRINGPNVRTSNILSLRALTLFNAIAKGHYVISGLKKIKKLKSTQKEVSRLIEAVKKSQNNDFEYINNLFQSLLSSIQKEAKHYLLRSEIERLNPDLKEQLVQFGDYDTFTVSPFLKSLGFNVKNTELCKEYVWTIENEQFDRMINLKGDDLASGNVYAYSLNSNRGHVVRFVPLFMLSASSNPDICVLIVRVVSLPWLVRQVSMTLSVCIPELNYCNNDLTKVMKGVSEAGMYVGSNKKLKSANRKIDKLVIRFSLRFVQ